MESVARDLPKNLTDAWNSMKEAMKTNNRESIQQADAKLKAGIDAYQKQAQAGAPVAQKAAVAKLADMRSTVKSATEAAASTTTNTEAPSSTVVKPTTGTTPSKPAPAKPTLTPAGIKSFTKITEGPSSGQRLRQEVASTTTAAAANAPAAGGRGAPGAHPMAGGAGGQPIPVTLAPGTGITVNFTGACPHCGKDVNTQGVGSTVNVAHKASG
jgi:hypothetical protein